MTYRIVGAQVADAVEQRIRPSGSAKTISYLPSKVTEQIHQERPLNTTGALGLQVLKNIIEEEQVSSLVDLLFRRCDLGWSRDHGNQYLEPIAKTVAKILGWDDSQLQEQISDYHRFIGETLPSYR